MGFIRQLQIFVTVAEMGNFTRAADTLHMARPGITKAIGELEKSVGVRLLQRTTRRTSLTGEGEAFYTKATELLREVEVTQNLFGGSKERPSGRLRIDIPVALAKSLVIPELPKFRQLYPDISVILGVNDQPIDLIANSVDCVLRLGELPISSMIGRKIATVKMVICASPEYLDRQGTPSSLEDLKDHMTINYFSGQKHTPLSWHFSHNGNVEEVMLSGALMANDAEAVVACALNHMGLIQVPGILVSEVLSQGKLVRVLGEISDVDFPLSIMYPNRQYLAPQVRTFIDWMIKTTDSQKGLWIR